MKSYRQVMFLLIAVAVILMASTSAYAARGNNSTSNGITGMPVSFLIDDIMSVHENDIKDNMFEHKFESASVDPSKQAQIIIERAREINETAEKTQKRVSALSAEADNGTVSRGQISKIFDASDLAMDRISASSAKVEDRVKNISKSNGTHESDLSAAISELEKARNTTGQRNGNGKAGTDDQGNMDTPSVSPTATPGNNGKGPDQAGPGNNANAGNEDHDGSTDAGKPGNVENPGNGVATPPAGNGKDKAKDGDNDKEKNKGTKSGSNIEAASSFAVMPSIPIPDLPSHYCSPAELATNRSLKDGL